MVITTWKQLDEVLLRNPRNMPYLGLCKIVNTLGSWDMTVQFEMFYKDLCMNTNHKVIQYLDFEGEYTHTRRQIVLLLSLQHDAKNLLMISMWYKKTNPIKI